MKFALNPRAILMAISPANNDISNSESLKFCRKVDPLGERTICVITKIDLYDGSSKNLEKLLNNELIQLKQGFILTTMSGLEQDEVLLGRLKEKFPAVQLKEHFGKLPLLKKLLKLLECILRPAIPQLRANIQGLIRVCLTET